MELLTVVVENVAVVTRTEEAHLMWLRLVVLSLRGLVGRVGGLAGAENSGRSGP